jgi:transposase-like protein
MKKFPPEIRAKIIAALKANPNASAVARQLGGVSFHTVGRIARQAGIRLAAATGERRVVTPEQRAKIIAALEANPNASAVARQLGDVKRRTIRKIARQAGIRLATAAGERRVVTPEKRAKIIAALKTNPNARAVARQLGGVSGVTVWKIARQVGIDLAAATGERRVVTPEQRAKIVAALKTNPNARAVARQLGGVSYFTVGKIAKKTGIDLAAAKAARRALPPERRAKIIAALKANPNARAVARQVGGACYATVRLIAKQTGIRLSCGRPARRDRKGASQHASI